MGLENGPYRTIWLCELCTWCGKTHIYILIYRLWFEGNDMAWGTSPRLISLTNIPETPLGAVHPSPLDPGTKLDWATLPCPQRPDPTLPHTGLGPFLHLPPLGFCSGCAFASTRTPFLPFAFSALPSNTKVIWDKWYGHLGFSQAHSADIRGNVWMLGLPSPGLLCRPCSLDLCKKAQGAMFQAHLYHPQPMDHSESVSSSSWDL